VGCRDHEEGERGGRGVSGRNREEERGQGEQACGGVLAARRAAAHGSLKVRRSRGRREGMKLWRRGRGRRPLLLASARGRGKGGEEAATPDLGQEAGEGDL
jgi:hypothetical protein